jgi:predicted DNA-binding transcriptional regulator AlpA
VKAKKELLEWLSKAHEHPEVSKRECAQLLGLKHRETVYELLKEREDG